MSSEVANIRTKSMGHFFQLSRSLRAYLLLIILSTIWGLAFVAIRVADSLLSPINLTVLRWLIAAAGYLVVLPVLGRTKTRFESRDLPRLLVISFANVPLYHLTLNYGEISVSAGLAGLLVSLGPVFVVLLSRVSLKEKIGKKLGMGLGVATTGALILSVPDLGGSAATVVGPLEVVLTAVAYSIFAVLSKPLVAKYGALPVAIRAGTIGTVMLLPLLSRSFLVQVGTLPVVGWVSVLYLSVLSTVLGYSMFYTLISRSVVSRLAIQLYLIPIVSVMGGVLILGETVSVFTVAGGAMLLLAIALATSSQSKK